MKKIFIVLGAAIAASPSAFGFLDVSDVTTMSLPVYGIYTTTDASCQTGLMATVALTKTPQTINFAQKPAIGSGPVPSTIGCVIIVIGNSLGTAWPAGNYTGSSAGGGTNPTSYSDSKCNGGGSTTGQAICGNGALPTWPQQILTDAAAIGLTLLKTACNRVATDVVPLVLSTNSICTGQAAADSAVAACANVNMNNFAMPTKVGDPANGTKLVAPATGGNLKFVVNPANTLGGSGSGATDCGNISAPLFSFAAN